MVEKCKCTCQNVKLSMDHYTLKRNMYTLPLGGCDIVLGGAMVKNFGIRVVEFCKDTDDLQDR